VDRLPSRPAIPRRSAGSLAGRSGQAPQHGHVIEHGARELSREKWTGSPAELRPAARAMELSREKWTGSVQALLEGWNSRSGARAPLRKCGKASRSQRACSRWSAALRQLPSQRVNHSLELSLHLGGVRLVDDGAHQGCHSRAACDPATLASRSRKLVGPRPLPGDPG